MDSSSFNFTRIWIIHIRNWLLTDLPRQLQRRCRQILASDSCILKRHMVCSPWMHLRHDQLHLLLHYVDDERATSAPNEVVHVPCRFRKPLPTSNVNFILGLRSQTSGTLLGNRVLLKWLRWCVKILHDTDADGKFLSHLWNKSKLFHQFLPMHWLNFNDPEAISAKRQTHSNIPDCLILLFDIHNHITAAISIASSLDCSHGSAVDQSRNLHGYSTLLNCVRMR